MDIGLRPHKIVEKDTDDFCVRKADLGCGDSLLVVTKNSVYHVHVLENDFYLVSGGWFDRNGLSPVKVKINGCTWGGNIIKTDILAACGVHLEFGNNLITSPIQYAIVLHYVREIRDNRN